MKNLLYRIFLGLLVVFFTASCEDLEDTNVDPSNPRDVPSNMVMSGTQKEMMDYVYDNWFSGRQCLVYSQYWAQRNYTEEDRYQIRESVNNGYWNRFYTIIANLDRVISMNTDPQEASKSVIYGNNKNQIAVAKILRVWLFSVMTDTWGSIPYFGINRLASENKFYAKYDDQKDIYYDMIKELTDAANMINVDEVAFKSGDVIYGGDPELWKKFANSLKCRLALHLSKVDAKWKTYIAEAVNSGVFESNDDGAYFRYTTVDPEYCKFYEGFFIDGRNDFTVTRPFIDILKGQKDTLNNKTHPWEGVEDPRLALFTTPRGGKFIGMPYGIPSNQVVAAYRNAAPTWYTTATPVVLKQDFPVPMMSYAELKFILSEYNGFSKSDYQEGVTASIKKWIDINFNTKTITKELVAQYEALIPEYVAKVSVNVTPEAVALQKYIDLFMNGTEAWVELRRTGYPIQLLRPGEISVVKGAANVLFEPLSDTKGDIIARVKYPTNESTLNGAAFTDAVSKLKDGTNNYYSKMFWDVRTSTYDHPTNK